MCIGLSGIHGETEAQWGTFRPSSTDPSLEGPAMCGHVLRGTWAWL